MIKFFSKAGFLNLFYFILNIIILYFTLFYSKKHLFQNVYKRYRLEKEVQRKKQACALKNYLQRTSGSTETKPNSACTTLYPVLKENTKSSESDGDQQVDVISKPAGTDTAPTPNQSPIKNFRSYGKKFLGNARAARPRLKCCKTVDAAAQRIINTEINH